jgi:hypothetical protein
MCLVSQSGAGVVADVNSQELQVKGEWEGLEEERPRMGEIQTL